MKKSLMKFVCIAIAMITCTMIVGEVSNATTRTSVSAGISSIISHCINNEVNNSLQRNQLKEDDRSFAMKIEQDTVLDTVCGYTNLGVANVIGSLNIRKGPSTNDELAGKLPTNAGCEILSSSNGWSEIRSGKVT